ncbi:MAG: hypothetical protein ACJAWW_002022 [Sulfurimonas sp.]|jgi:hypothetical protein
MYTIAKQYADFFEALSAQDSKEKYEIFFDKNSYFEDPFQKVQGLDAICKVFEHMYKTLHNPKFIVEETVSNDAVTYLRWNFTFKLSKNAQKQSFVGVSRVEFTPEGKVLRHVDYWDAAQNVYEKVPLLGSVLRLIKRRLHA